MLTIQQFEKLENFQFWLTYPVIKIQFSWHFEKVDIPSDDVNTISKMFLKRVWRTF